ncbi:MAG: hypothetical protein R3B70_15445 [Polyangiaceae bacterium]
MKFNFGGHEIILSQPSGWYIPGTGDSLSAGASRSIGLSFGPKKIIDVSVGLQGGYNWIQVANYKHKTAEALSMPDGTPLPAWERFYWLQMQIGGFNLSAGIGPSFRNLSGSASTATRSNASAGIEEEVDGEKQIGVVHRHPSAPEGGDYERGDPTGFMGAALQDGLVAQGAIGFGVAGGVFTLALGCVFEQQGLLVATATRLAQILTGVAGIEHLLFKYSAAYWATGDAYGVGGSVGVSMEVAQVEHLHCFVVHPPTGVEIYCYTRSLRDGAAGSKYSNRNMTQRYPQYNSAAFDDYVRAIELDRQLEGHLASWRSYWATAVGGMPTNATNDQLLQNLAARRQKATELNAILDRRGGSPVFSDIFNKWALGFGNSTTLREEMRAGL